MEIADIFKISKSINFLVKIKNVQWTGGSGEGTVRTGDYRNYYKGHVDKIKGEGVLAGVGWRDGKKRRTTVIE